MMQFRKAMLLGNSRRRGFTLIEVVIVIAIMMVIFASMFGIIRLVRNRAAVDMASNQIFQIVTNMRDNYMSRNISAVTAGVANMAYLITAGVFPVDMLVPSPPSGQLPSGNEKIHHLWAQSQSSASSVSITRIEDFTPPGAVQPLKVFLLRYSLVPSDVCVDLVGNTATPGPETGLMEIDVGSHAFKIGSSLPPPKKDLVAACFASSSIDVTWYFKLSP